MTGESKGSWPKGGNLPVGSLIDQNSKWIDNMAAYTDEWDPGCAVGNTCIYGVQFQILGDVHYGWVEFHEGLTNQSLIRWAYESNANIGILAGDMGAIPIAPTPALVFIGAAALGFFRKFPQRKQSRPIGA